MSLKRWGEGLSRFSMTLRSHFSKSFNAEVGREVSWELQSSQVGCCATCTTSSTLWELWFYMKKVSKSHKHNSNHTSDSEHSTSFKDSKTITQRSSTHRDFKYVHCECESTGTEAGDWCSWLSVMSPLSSRLPAARDSTEAALIEEEGPLPPSLIILAREGLSGDWRSWFSVTSPLSSRLPAARDSAEAALIGGESSLTLALIGEEGPLPPSLIISATEGLSVIEEDVRPRSS